MKRGSERGFAPVSATRTTIDFTAVRAERSPASEGARGIANCEISTRYSTTTYSRRVIRCDVRRRSSRCAGHSRPTVRPDLTSPSFAERLAGLSLSARRARSDYPLHSPPFSPPSTPLYRYKCVLALPLRAAKGAGGKSGTFKETQISFDDNI